jgi:hydrogenase maturation protease
MAAHAATEIAEGTVATPTVLIAGLGNCLLTDDGIGVHAVRLLQQQPPRASLPVEVGTDLFSLVPLLSEMSMVLAIDAMDAGGVPGTIYRCDSRDIAEPGLKTSLHEMGLISILEFVTTERRPDITILGIQPARIELGLELSPMLFSILPQVVEIARAIVKELTRDYRCLKTRPNLSLL